MEKCGFLKANFSKNVLLKYISIPENPISGTRKSSLIRYTYVVYFSFHYIEFSSETKLLCSGNMVLYYVLYIKQWTSKNPFFLRKGVIFFSSSVKFFMNIQIYILYLRQKKWEENKEKPRVMMSLFILFSKVKRSSFLLPTFSC